MQWTINRSATLKREMPVRASGTFFSQQEFYVHGASIDDCKTFVLAYQELVLGDL